MRSEEAVSHLGEALAHLSRAKDCQWKTAQRLVKETPSDSSDFCAELEKFRGKVEAAQLIINDLMVGARYEKLIAEASGQIEEKE